MDVETAISGKRKNRPLEKFAVRDYHEEVSMCVAQAFERLARPQRGRLPDRDSELRSNALNRWFSDIPTATRRSIGLRDNEIDRKSVIYRQRLQRRHCELW